MKTYRTLNLIKMLSEQLEEGGELDPTQEPSEDVTENPVDVPEDVMPLTSEGENQYISDIIDAALFEPDSNDAQTLLNLQSVMKLKRFKNSREEVLPKVLEIIRPQTSATELKNTLNEI